MEDFVANAALLAGRLTHECEKAAASQSAAVVDLRAAAAGFGREVASGKAEIAQSAKLAIREVLSQEIPAAVEAFPRPGTA